MNLCGRKLVEEKIEIDLNASTGLLHVLRCAPTSLASGVGAPAASKPPLVCPAVGLAGANDLDDDG